MIDHTKKEMRKREKEGGGEMESERERVTGEVERNVCVYGMGIEN